MDMWLDGTFLHSSRYMAMIGSEFSLMLMESV